MWVVPGGIDSHVHFNLDVTEAMKAQSAIDGSRAGAFGGTTTFVDFAFQSGDGSAVEAVQRKQDELAGQRPNVDYALHVMLTGAIPFAVMDELPDLVAGGVPSVKMFTTFAAGSASGDLYSDDGRIWGVMQAASAAGGVVMVHCEDDCIIDYNVRRLYAAGRQAGANIAEARPPLAEEAAIRRMIVLAQRSGCPLYVVHVSSRWGVEAIREARGRRLPVYGEVLHNYLAFTNDRYAGEDGLLYHNYPPLKSMDDQAALWDAIAAGDLDTVASDDFTIPRAAKLSGPVVDNVPGGHNGIETRMDVLYSEGVGIRTAAHPAVRPADRGGAGEAVRPLPPQGHDRGGQRRRPRRHRPAGAGDAHPRPAALGLRLQPVGRLEADREGRATVLRGVGPGSRRGLGRSGADRPVRSRHRSHRTDRALTGGSPM